MKITFIELLLWSEQFKQMIFFRYYDCPQFSKKTKTEKEKLTLKMVK